MGALHQGSWTIGEVVRTFKAVSTRQIRQIAAPSFAWQRNYYEHIIRDDAALERIRDYIVTNPRQWELDQLHPDHPSTW